MARSGKDGSEQPQYKKDWTTWGSEVVSATASTLGALSSAANYIPTFGWGSVENTPAASASGTPDDQQTVEVDPNEKEDESSEDKRIPVQGGDEYGSDGEYEDACSSTSEESDASELFIDLSSTQQTTDGTLEDSDLSDLYYSALQDPGVEQLEHTITPVLNAGEDRNSAEQREGPVKLPPKLVRSKSCPVLFSERDTSAQKIQNTTIGISPLSSSADCTREIGDSNTSFSPPQEADGEWQPSALQRKKNEDDEHNSSAATEPAVVIPSNIKEEVSDKWSKPSTVKNNISRDNTARRVFIGLSREKEEKLIPSETEILTNALSAAIKKLPETAKNINQFAIGLARQLVGTEVGNCGRNLSNFFKEKRTFKNKSGEKVTVMLRTIQGSLVLVRSIIIEQLNKSAAFQALVPENINKANEIARILLYDNNNVNCIAMAILNNLRHTFLAYGVTQDEKDLFGIKNLFNAIETKLGIKPTLEVKQLNSPVVDGASGSSTNNGISVASTSYDAKRLANSWWHSISKPSPRTVCVFLIIGFSAACIAIHYHPTFICNFMQTAYEYFHPTLERINIF